MATRQWLDIVNGKAIRASATADTLVVGDIDGTTADFSGVVVQSGGSLTLNDNISLRFGTSGGEGTITSDASNTTWDIVSGDLILEMADDAGSNKVAYHDSGSVEVASIDSDGNIQGDGTLAMDAATGTSTFAHNVDITGNLIVQGTTTTNQSETVNYSDNHLYLNDGYTTVSAETGGLVINYLPTATTDTVAATGFVAGVAATSNPTVITTGSATFAVGDFIQVSGAADQSNDGLFEVLTHTGTTLTIAGIGLTATTDDFTQNQFVTDTTVQGAITKVNVSILRAGTDGLWETAVGSTAGPTFNDLAVGGSSPFQTTSNVANLIASTDNLTIGSATNLAKVGVDGDTDEIQLLVQGNGTQTADLFVVESSAGADYFTIDGSGNPTLADDLVFNFGTDDDWTVGYDETTDDSLEITGAASAADVAGTGFAITGSDGGDSVAAVAGAGGTISATAGDGGDAADLAAAGAGVGGGFSFQAGVGGDGIGGGTDNYDGAAGGTVQLTAGAGGVGDTGQTGGSGGGLTLTAGAAGAAGGGTQGVGGDVTINAGDGLTDGDVILGSSNTDMILLGNATNNTDITQVGTGPVTWNGAMTANEGGTFETTAAGVKVTATHDVAADTNPAIAVTYGAVAFVGEPDGLSVDFSGATSVTSANDFYGAEFIGETNAGAGDSVGIRISGFDTGAEIAGGINPVADDADTIGSSGLGFTTIFLRNVDDDGTFALNGTGVDVAGGELVGVDDAAFANIVGDDVQKALASIDGQLAEAGPWDVTSNVTHLDVGTDTVTIGSATGGGKLFVDGDADEIQLQIQANSTNTSDVMIVETSAGADLFAVGLTAAGFPSDDYQVIYGSDGYLNLNSGQTVFQLKTQNSTSANSFNLAAGTGDTNNTNLGTGNTAFGSGQGDGDGTTFTGNTTLLTGSVTNGSATGQTGTINIQTGSNAGSGSIGTINFGPGGVLALQIDENAASYSTNVVMQDNQNFFVGTGNDYTLVGTGTNTFVTTTGTHSHDSQVTSGGVTYTLGTNTSATTFGIASDDNTVYFQVRGDGRVDVSDGTLDVPAGTSYLINGTALTTANYTAANVDTLLDGSDASALHTHASAPAMVISGLTTTAMAAANRIAYFSAADTVDDALADGTGIQSHAVGVYTGTSGEIQTGGVVTIDFTTDGGSPSNGDCVFLALASEDTSTGTGKATGTAPAGPGEFIACIGTVQSNANYAGSKTCEVLLNMPICWAIEIA